MPEQTVGIVIKARDEASGTLSKLSTNFADLQKKMKPATDASKAFALGLAGAATAAVAFGVQAVKAAADAQASTAKTAAIYKTLGFTIDQTAQYMENMGDFGLRFGFDDEEAQLAGARLQQLMGAGEEAGEALSVAFDLARYKGIELSQATELVGQVFNGNGKVLKNFGIELTETTKPWKAIAELQDKVGGQSDAFIQSFAGQMQVFNLAWGNFMEDVGAKLLPLATEIMLNFNEFAVTTLPKVITAVQDASMWLTEHKLVLELIAGAIVGGLMPAILFSLIPAIVAATAAFAAGAIALAPWVLGGVLIAGLIAGIVWLVKNWDIAKEKIVAAWKWIRENIEPWVVFFLGPAGFLVKATMDAVENVVKNWDEYRDKIMAVFNAVKDFLTDHWETIKTIFSAGVSACLSILGPLGSMIKLVMTGIDKINAMGGVSGVWDKVVDFAKGADEAVKGNYARMAAGGIVTGPTFAQIGEAGPEAVIPLNRLGSLGGGNMTVNITGNYIRDNIDIRQLARQVGEQIAREVKFQTRI